MTVIPGWLCATANSLILRTVWYVLMVWAEDLTFSAKIQRMVEEFVWAGRSRVNRNAMTQCKSKGGLGLILVIEYYRAIAGNILLWALGIEYHPLRLILCFHLRELSQPKWGYPDYTWVTTKGGSKSESKSLEGSIPGMAEHLHGVAPPQNLSGGDPTQEF